MQTKFEIFPAKKKHHNLHRNFDFLKLDRDFSKVFSDYLQNKTKKNKGHKIRTYYIVRILHSDLRAYRNLKNSETIGNDS